MVEFDSNWVLFASKPVAFPLVSDGTSLNMWMI